MFTVKFLMTIHKEAKGSKNFKASIVLNEVTTHTQCTVLGGKAGYYLNQVSTSMATMVDLSPLGRWQEGFLLRMESSHIAFPREG